MGVEAFAEDLEAGTYCENGAAVRGGARETTVGDEMFCGEHLRAVFAAAERVCGEVGGDGFAQLDGQNLCVDIAHACAPAQDEEFVLYHCDNIQATGFLEHIKLPHYVDFQAELELVRRLRADAAGTGADNNREAAE